MRRLNSIAAVEDRVADNKMPFKDNQPSSKLERTLSKQYDFDIKSLFSRANGLAKANFLSLFQASLVLFLTFVVLGFVAQKFITFNEDGTFIFEHQSLIEIVAIFIVAPLIGGLYMMGVSHARGQKNHGFLYFQLRLYNIRISPYSIGEWHCGANWLGIVSGTWCVFLDGDLFFTHAGCR